MNKIYCSTTFWYNKVVKNQTIPSTHCSSYVEFIKANYSTRKCKKKKLTIAKKQRFDKWSTK